MIEVGEKWVVLMVKVVQQTIIDNFCHCFFLLLLLSRVVLVSEDT